MDEISWTPVSTHALAWAEMLGDVTKTEQPATHHSHSCDEIDVANRHDRESNAA